MLEIPEAAVLGDAITRHLAEKRVTGVEAGHSPHKWAWYHGDPSDYPSRLKERIIQSAHGRGGLVEIIAEDARLYFGDGVRLRLTGPGEKLPAKHQLRLDFEDGSVLCASVQMYGGLWACGAGEAPTGFVAIALSKPSPLDVDFTEAYFLSVLKDVSPRLSVKAALATEQRVPGLGNGVLQDILFAAGIHPKRKLEGLTSQDLAALYRAVVDTLRTMYQNGGRDTEALLDGNPGGYRTILSRITVGKPCPVCGTVIEKASYLGGSIYYCSSCQPL